MQVLIKAMKEDINQQIYFVWNDLLTGNRIGVNSVSNSVQMGNKKSRFRGMLFVIPKDYSLRS